MIKWFTHHFWYKQDGDVENVLFAMVLAVLGTVTAITLLEAFLYFTQGIELPF